MDPVIETDQLTMHFRRCEALTQMSLQVQPGSVFALLGENGAGKTTLIRILTGYQRPTSGTARVCGIDPTSDALAIRRRIGYVSDAPALYDWMTIGEIGWFAASFYSPPYMERYLQSILRYGLPPDRKIKHLSKGQRAKVALSLSLSHDPELLILDEPTSGLDPKVRRDFLESMIDLAAAGRTVFLSSHQINEVERVADNIAIMHEGRLKVCCPLNELKDSVTELTITLEDPLLGLPQLPASAQLLSAESSGRMRRLVLRNFSDDMLPAIGDATNVTGLSRRSLSLEEIFIAATHKSSAPPDTPDRSGPPDDTGPPDGGTPPPGAGPRESQAAAETSL